MVDTKLAQAIHILVYISETEKIASSQALAESVGTNASHIRKLTSLLKQAGLVESRQGKSGFFLANPKDQITLADIYTALYSGKNIFHAHEHPNPECPIGKHIKLVLTPTFNQMEQQLVDTLRDRTLDDVIHDLYQSAQS